MKKKIILILLILFFIIFGTLTSLYCIDQNRMRNNEPVLFSTWGKKYAPALEENTPEDNTPIEEQKEPEYMDENPVKIGIYIEQGNNLVLITNDYICDWSPENVMGL